MRKFIFPIFLISILIAGCSGFYPNALINGIEKKTIETQCGKIELQSGHYTNILFSLDQQYIGSDFIANLDSLRIMILPEKSVEIKEINWSKKGQKIKDRILTVQNEEKIGLHIMLEDKLPNGSSIVILPSNVITCQGESVLKDTLFLISKNF